jgi:hypothetical protein
MSYQCNDTFMGKLFGCKFEPRYDSHMPDNFKIRNAYTEDLLELRVNVYVKDVCVRCGHEIFRGDSK